MFRANTRPRRQNSGKQHEGKRFPSHLQWLRGRPCIIVDKHKCSGRMEAAHFDGAGGKGMGMKVADYHAFPACSDAHSELHRIGQDSWQAKYRISLAEAVRDYAHVSPHKHLWIDQ